MLSELLARAAAEGLQLNNLYQLSTGAFRANFRRGEAYSTFITHPDAEECLRLALEVALVACVEPEVKPKKMPPIKPLSKPVDLVALGLLRKPNP